MITKKKYLFQLYLYLLLLLIYFKVQAKNVTITSKETTEDIVHIIENLSLSKDIDEIKLVFKDKIHKVSFEANNNFNFYKNITFYSIDGIIFDFQKHYSGQMTINVSEGTTMKKIVFENISFINFKNLYNTGVNMISFNISGENNNFQIEFKNCTFYNNIGNLLYFRYEGIKKESVQPHVILNDCKFTIFNTTFNNCYSYSEFLIHISSYYYYKYNKFSDTNNTFNLLIENSTFNVSGGEINVSITNSKFHNINGKTPTPLILDIIYSKIKIENCEFKNIKSILSSLFNEESIYSFRNVTFKDITVNSKSIIDILYNSITFDNCFFSNILCNGESEHSSLLTFTSSDYGNALKMNNVTIENSKSNGNLILIKGNMSNIELSNLNINKIYSYGSVINNLSLNVSK
ncbi:hypothetical protein BCR32DRAFT_246689 [Anaeromyces robustus]|uniref:Right handed beta helix domain-containing protein n=1 Tax=Anaeromyces robustus TaxID=1754192 RepID=A0A1Y1X0U9_9FUNG|nr:hypothetical protein BCR32DRAFT_246689 [Anaeromyces robustus]|eukprot:ORX79036.1 hypothetical protein BCR32DRAFT_246689 [Anaeromyces robustus]